MGDLHTKYESGAMFTAGSDYGTTGTSGLNEISNRINVESGILGLVSGALYDFTNMPILQQTSADIANREGTMEVGSGLLTTTIPGNAFIIATSKLVGGMTSAGTMTIFDNDNAIGSGMAWGIADTDTLNISVTYVGSMSVGAHWIEVKTSNNGSIAIQNPTISAIAMPYDY